jgi:hypothetical protein
MERNQLHEHKSNSVQATATTYTESLTSFQGAIFWHHWRIPKASQQKMM